MGQQHQSGSVFAAYAADADVAEVDFRKAKAERRATVRLLADEVGSDDAERRRAALLMAKQSDGLLREVFAEISRRKGRELRKLLRDQRQ
ncbi:MAG TPA: hypothetical protein VK547_09575 [Candidatus Udaeobacter sp.]|nr:hypothetical protein [Candidatus Udaeobacter sp.]